MSIIIPVITSIFVFLFSYVIWYYVNIRRYPPGPTPIPFFGNVLQLERKNTHKQFERFAQRYGPVFTVFIPLPTVIITGLEEMREALLKKANIFAGRPTTPTDSLFMNCSNGGIIFSEGETWMEQRKFAHTTLRQFGMEKNLMERRIHIAISALFEHFDKCDLTNIDINWPIQLCVGNIIHDLLFGFDCSFDEGTPIRHFQDLIQTAMEMIRSRASVLLVQAHPWIRYIPLMGWWGYWELRATAECLLDYVGEQIENGKRNLNLDNEPETFVAAYLHEIERRKRLNDVRSFSEANLTNVVLDLWLAGMETAASTVRWGLLLITAHPETQRKMRAEINANVGERRITMADRHMLPYCVAAINEIHRVGNVVTFNVFHKTSLETTVAGLKIPRGTTVLPQITSVLSSEKYFKNADQFLPERYLDYSGGTPVLRKELLENLVPFAMGKRQCAGEPIARVELFLIITRIVQTYTLNPSDDRSDINLDPIFGILQAPHPFNWKLEKIS